jgi:antitoxin component of MazEF toxin-antitoxin module
MKQPSKIPFDAKSFEIVTLSEQKLGGKPSQYRISIPARLINQMNWHTQEKLVIEARTDKTLIIRPMSALYVEDE